MLRILLIDNYDSFTYNLEHYIVSAGGSVHVVLNDQVHIESVLSYDGIVLSPGPDLPSNAGLMMSLLDFAAGKVPILGVCLGMQGIAEFLGGRIYNQEVVRHGVKTIVKHDKSELFRSLPDEFEAGLYHSWAVEEGEGDFHITGRSSENVVMAIENKEKNLYGVQFHPESVMTGSGKQILENFLAIVRLRKDLNPIR